MTTPDVGVGAGLTAVEDLLTAAEDELLALANGSALCHIDGPRGAVKAAEGRTVALREARRILRRGDGPADLRRILAEWEQPTIAGADWQAYRNGGVAALRGLIAGFDPASVPDGL